MFHCGLLLKEVLVAPKVGSSWEAVVSTGEAEGGTSMSLTSPDGMSCRNVFVRAISGANACSFSQFIWIH